MTLRSRFRFAQLLGVACLAAFVAACATAPPVQEMSDARQAIAAAKEAGAQELAVDQLTQAEELLVMAEKWLQAGGSSAYWQAKQAAISAKEIAFEALLTSRSERESTGSDGSQ